VQAKSGGVRSILRWVRSTELRSLRSLSRTGTPKGADGVAILNQGRREPEEIGVQPSARATALAPAARRRSTDRFAHLTAHPATPEPSVQAKSGLGCAVMAHRWHTPGRPQTQHLSQKPRCAVRAPVVCHQQSSCLFRGLSCLRDLQRGRRGRESQSRTDAVGRSGTAVDARPQRVVRAMRRRSSAAIDAATTPGDAPMTPFAGQQTLHSSQIRSPGAPAWRPLAPLWRPLETPESRMVKP
jgi:hypothetical protein